METNKIHPAAFDSTQDVMPDSCETTPEEFYAEGTTSLADSNSALDLYKHMEQNGAAPRIETVDGNLKSFVVEHHVERREDHTYTIPDHVGDTVKIKIDGDRTQLTETQMGAVVEEVLDQTLTRYEINGVEVPKYFADESTERANQICYLAKKVIELEDFNKKLLTALKQHGFDTVKLFR